MTLPSCHCEADGVSRSNLAVKHEIATPRQVAARNDATTELNGHVERAQRTHTEEFYEVTDTSFEIAELNQALLEWERVHNAVRPHQALGYLAPEEFLKLHRQNKRKEEVSLII
jgi:transposase InsO family protein